MWVFLQLCPSLVQEAVEHYLQAFKRSIFSVGETFNGLFQKRMKDFAQLGGWIGKKSRYGVSLYRHQNFEKAIVDSNDLRNGERLRDRHESDWIGKNDYAFFHVSRDSNRCRSLIWRLASSNVLENTLLTFRPSSASHAFRTIPGKGSVFHNGCTTMDQ